MNSSKKRKVVNKTDRSKDVKQQKTAQWTGLLSRYFLEEEFKVKIGDALRNNKAFSDNGCIIYNTPFKCCVLPNFITDEDFLKTLEKELLQLKFFEKSNDLYKFQQSDDLRKSSKTTVSSLRNILYHEFRMWLQDVSGFDDLTDQVDMSCAKYKHTDVLLCHDDELEGRRIAYIFYLVPPWESEDGGTLDLFCTDGHGQPDQITASLVPQWNSLVFFEVTPISFHQVSEVLSANKTRLSVSGWFHGDNIARPAPYQEPHPALTYPVVLEDEALVSWINPLYLDAGVVKDIRARFKDESEIELQDFLLTSSIHAYNTRSFPFLAVNYGMRYQEAKYQEVTKALREKEVKWKWIGPANKRHYEQVVMDSLPSVIQQLMMLLQSEPMFKLLRAMTGLEMASIALSDDDDDEDGHDHEQGASVDSARALSSSSRQGPCCHGNIRRWSHGCYTLVHDTDPEGAEFALDLLLYVAGKGWKTDYGGYTTYLTSGEDDELLTVNPQENSLAMVYRDKETLKFVKHVNHLLLTDEGPANRDNSFYDFSFVYFE